MQNKTCATCVFWLPHSEPEEKPEGGKKIARFGTCRRYPPTVTEIGDKTMRQGRPQITENDLCGEYSYNRAIDDAVPLRGGKK